MQKAVAVRNMIKHRKPDQPQTKTKREKNLAVAKITKRKPITKSLNVKKQAPMKNLGTKNLRSHRPTHGKEL